jgi:hypothetical protein
MSPEAGDAAILRVEPPPTQPAREPIRRPARVAQILVKAHQIREAIDNGIYTNASAAAAAWGMSRNRMSQVLALTYLAPDIQLEVMGLEAVDGVEPPITEKWLFEKVARLLRWEEQRDVCCTMSGSKNENCRFSRSVGTACPRK